MTTETRATTNINLKFMVDETSVVLVCISREELCIVIPSVCLSFDGVEIEDPMSLDFISIKLAPISCSMKQRCLA